MTSIHVVIFLYRVISENCVPNLRVISAIVKAVNPLQCAQKRSLYCRSSKRRTFRLVQPVPEKRSIIEPMLTTRPARQRAWIYCLYSVGQQANRRHAVQKQSDALQRLRCSMAGEQTDQYGDLMGGFNETTRQRTAGH